jgi:hypothetical protein
VHSKLGSSEVIATPAKVILAIGELPTGGKMNDKSNTKT